MGLREAGLPARDYSNNRKKIMCKLYEGDLKYNANAFGKDGKSTEDWTVTAPIAVGTYVELHEDSTAKHIIVKPAAANSKKVIGKVIFDARLRWTPDWTNGDKNRLPKEDKSWGEYSPRSATVEFFGDAVDYVDVASENAEIKPYDYIAFKDQAFDKASGSSKTSLIALGGVEALKEGKVVVLSNPYFYGA